MEQYLEDYVQFVNDHVAKYHEYTELVRDAIEITPEVINTALVNYGKVYDMLIAEYYRKKADLKEVEMGYQEWWDEKFCKVRSDINKYDIAGTKWLSRQEIESEVRNQNRDDYKDWQAKLFKAEQETNFLSRKLEQWKKLDTILINISYNMRSELKSLSLENRMNKRLDQPNTRTIKR